MAKRGVMRVDVSRRAIGLRVGFSAAALDVAKHGVLGVEVAKLAIGLRGEPGALGWAVHGECVERSWHCTGRWLFGSWPRRGLASRIKIVLALFCNFVTLSLLIKM